MLGQCKWPNPINSRVQDPACSPGNCRAAPAPLVPCRFSAGSAFYLHPPGAGCSPRPSQHPEGAGHRPHPPLSAAAHTSLLALLSPFRWLGGATASPMSSFSFLGALGFPVCKPPSGLPRGLRSWWWRETKITFTGRQEGMGDSAGCGGSFGQGAQDESPSMRGEQRPHSPSGHQLVERCR